jgi:hypothetical protein
MLVFRILYKSRQFCDVREAKEKHDSSFRRKNIHSFVYIWIMAK